MPGAGGGGWGVTTMGMSFSFQGEEDVTELDSGHGCTILGIY